LHEVGKLQTLETIVVDESYITKMQMQNLWEKGLTWKSHNHNYANMAFLK
jgi:hypothetical protein